MPSSYEFWLLDDAGKRINLMPDPAFFSYSRSVAGISTLLIGFPYLEYKEFINPIFTPDHRVDVWRSPDTGMPLRREQTYLLRLYKIYTRKSDGVQMITFYGRDAKDLLRRRRVIQYAGFSQTQKTDYIDDMMKEIVKEQMLWGSAVDEDGNSDNTRAYPENEFFVEGDESLGPTYTYTFADRNVLDVLNALRDASIELKEASPLLNTRIYFDIVPYDVQSLILYILDEDDCTPILDESGLGIVDESSPDITAELGWQFVTYPDLVGIDRTAESLIFSVENSNLEEPYFSLNHNEEENSIIVKGYGRGDSRLVDTVEDDVRIGASRWNLCEGYVDASTEPDQDSLSDYAYPALWDGAPKEEISAVFLNVPGRDDTPRSLYGVDWDLGDLLPVSYAGRQFNVEVQIVYVAIDESGQETITGRSDINASDQ